LTLVARFACVCAALSVGLVAAGCGSATTTEAAAKNDVKSEYDQSGRLTRLTYDRNGDGKIDTWGYMDGARVVRVEVDEDGDGKVDRWEYHKDPSSPAEAGRHESSGGSTDSAGSHGSNNSAGSKGSTTTDASGGDVTLERIDKATKHDGKISRREYFDNGFLTRVEEDTDGDGKIDKWETYSAGTLATLAIDMKGRGTPDRRLIYLPDGTLSRIETDPSGTGMWRPLPK
jgi:antitoxin component YwqK of YwqJK toxin-antitoxin module